MKVEEIEPKKFQPVKLVLETQDEVDKLYAIANLAPLQNLIGLENMWQLLIRYKSSGYMQYHNLLDKCWKN
ncbi:MAG: hypothetical protein PHG53_09725 [Phycisphaerae bacterium]|nr:hypothetical protein [Phycisphaerae bacterium]